MSSLLTRRQRPCVNHGSSFPVIFQQVDHLQQPALEGSSPYEPFVVVALLRPWSPRCTDNGFNLFGLNAVSAYVLQVPFVPAELHVSVLI